jgi:hypothetical protein
MKHVASFAGFLLGLLLDLEDRGMILCNVGSLSTDYMALHARREKCSLPCLQNSATRPYS